MASKRPKFFTAAKFPADPRAVLGEGEGVTQPVLGYVDAWHKLNLEKYNVACDYIGSRLAQQIGLPVPPFAVTHRKKGQKNEFYFSSLDFNSQREQLAFVDPDAFAVHMPFEATGIVLLDVLIANEDRWGKNLVVDEVEKPTMVQVFDHDTCLLRGFDLQGTARLQRERDEIGTIKFIGNEQRQHFLMEHIRSYEHFEEWYLRIGSIPKWLIDEACGQSTELGLTKSEAQEASDFLIHRRNSIRKLIATNQKLFSNISDWPQEGLLEGVS